MKASAPEPRARDRFRDRWPGLYAWLVRWIGPGCHVWPEWELMLPHLREGARILNIGSGVKKRGAHQWTIDFQPLPGLSLQGDAERLPVRTASVDGAVCEAALEHIREPEAAIAESFRVLRPGGVLYLYAPFIAPFHAAPDDYRRWTIEGLRHVLGSAGFEIVLLAPRSGPTSAVIWVMAEYLALLLSFGIRRLRALWAALFLIAFFPLKFLDLVLVWMPGSEIVSLGFHAVVRKPAAGAPPGRPPGA